MLTDQIPMNWRTQAGFQASEPQRILVIRLDNIGDLMMLSPALRALREAYPNAEITLMTSPAGGQVTPLFPWIDEAMVWQAVWQDVSGKTPFNPAREAALIEQLREQQFDTALIFTSFSQSPFPPAYVCYLAGIPTRVGFSKEFGGKILSVAPVPPADDEYQVNRNLALLEALNIPVHNREPELHISQSVQSRAKQHLGSVGIKPEAPYIVLAPGASCQARRYDPARFAAVARALAEQTDLPLVIVGSAQEAESIAPVTQVAYADAHRRVRSLVGYTSVPELAAIIRHASLVIANNSAPMHLAAAFHVPALILYSGTDRLSQWVSPEGNIRLLQQETSCSPCYNFNCPYAHECLEIAPEKVVEAALEILVKESGSELQLLKQEVKIGTA